MLSQLALDLATWAVNFEPTAEDLALAGRSLADTLAVALAARGQPISEVLEGLDEEIRWAALGHVLDFDDLHMGSTAHVSVVCVMATLAAGGDARAYLAGAGAMARIGTALGWQHYASGWHVTCTSGAPAAAVASGVAFGLGRDAIARAIALAIPGAGGVQRAFGSDGKSLQVGFATGAGVRAARLAGAGASADPRAFDEWFELMGGEVARFDLSGEAVPGGLAIKLYPCCYALQRPIGAMRDLIEAGLEADDVLSVRVETSEASIQPLIHHHPVTALEGKFSLEYAIAATLLDGFPGFSSFTDSAVQRSRAQELIACVELVIKPGGGSLLSDEIAIEVRRARDEVVRVRLAVPLGAPSRPLDDEALRAKHDACGPDVPGLLAGIKWQDAPDLLRSQLGTSRSVRRV